MILRIIAAPSYVIGAVYRLEQQALGLSSRQNAEEVHEEASLIID